MQTSIDTSRFDKYVTELSQKLRISKDEAIRGEAASVLKIAASRQERGQAKTKEVREQTRRRMIKSFGGDNVDITTTKAGRVWVRNEGKFHLMGSNTRGTRLVRDGNRMPNTLWRTANKLWRDRGREINEGIKTALSSRGLGARSWIQSIEMLGFDPVTLGPQSARVSSSLTALTRRGKEPPRMAYIGESKGQEDYSLTVVNTSTITNNKGGQGIIDRAIRQRAGAFRNNLRSGVFNNAAEIARRYPGISTQ